MGGSGVWRTLQPGQRRGAHWMRFSRPGGSPGYSKSSSNALDCICTLKHTSGMVWEVRFAPEFDPEFDALPIPVQDELLARAKVLETFGPSLGRPRVDTLNGSRHANMKELRFNAGGGVWRVAFAFDPDRQAVLLVAGDKSGVSERRFYRRLVDKADTRYGRHLEDLEQRGRA